MACHKPTGLGIVPAEILGSNCAAQDPLSTIFRQRSQALEPAMQRQREAIGEDVLEKINGFVRHGGRDAHLDRTLLGAIQFYPLAD